VNLVDLSPEHWRGLILTAAFMLLLATRAVLDSRRQHAQLSAQIESLSGSLKQVVQQSTGVSEVLTELKRRAADQSRPVATLERIAQRLETPEPNEVYPALLNALSRCLPVQAASVYAVQGGRLIPRAHIPYADPAPDPERLLSSAALQHVLATHTLCAEPTLSDGPLMAAPLLDPDGVVVGVATIEQMPSISISPSAIRLFEIVAASASRGLRQALQLQGNASALLTFPQIMGRTWDELVRARRYGRSLSLVVVRIEGDDDASLDTESARLLSAALRPGDSVGRHRFRGGFICLLPETPAAGAGVVAKRLVGVLRDLDSRAPAVGVRTGVASLAPEISSTAALLAAADAATATFVPETGEPEAVV
jgi:hypothetical protein